MKFATFTHVAQKRSATIEQRLDEFAAEARLADDLGFDYFFTTEHHFSGRFSLAPSQAVSLAVVAQNTKRLRFGPMVIILPLTQPLRVVEELVILDHMSGGRLEIGLGRGITPHEHATYGIPPSLDREVFAEGLEFVLKALTTEGRFSWSGQHYQYFDIELPWRPLQQPHPPIWVPTNTPEVAYEYGRRGFGIGGFATAGLALFEKTFAEYRRGCEEVGIPADQQRTSLLASIIVADTDAEARELMWAHFPEQLALFEYERERSRASYDTSARLAAEGSLSRLRALLADLDGAHRDLRFICGSPETVVDKLKTIDERLGIGTFIGEFSFGELSYDTVARSYELFAAKVMPELRDGGVGMYP